MDLNVFHFNILVLLEKWTFNFCSKLAVVSDIKLFTIKIFLFGFLTFWHAFC